MNTVWVLLIVSSVILSILNGRVGEFTKAIFEGAKSAVEVSLFLLGIVALWLGITPKGVAHLGLDVSRLFPHVPRDHPALTSITLNLLANLFGLGNAATPLGIKAMQDLQSFNPDKDTITFEMMLFIVINTASIQLIPFTVIGILADFGAKNPAAVVLPTLLATVLSAAFAVGTLFVFRKVFK